MTRLPIPCRSPARAEASAPLPPKLDRSAIEAIVRVRAAAARAGRRWASTRRTALSGKVAAHRARRLVGVGHDLGRAEDARACSAPRSAARGATRRAASSA